MKINKFILLSGLIFSNCVFARAENFSLVLKIDIVEADDQPTKSSVLDNLDKLTRRNTGIQMKYDAGGTFTLQEFIENKFVLKWKDSELSLRAGYSKQTDFRFKIYYDVTLSYPMQENVVHFIDDFVMDYNDIKILSTTKLPDGPVDTKPYWIILRLEKVASEYFEEDIGGIGAFLNIKDGYPYILDITPESPADRSGLKIGDVIMEIDEADMYGKNLQESINKLRGKPGTQVKIKAKSPDKDETREVTIERVVIK